MCVWEGELIFRGLLLFLKLMLAIVLTKCLSYLQSSGSSLKKLEPFEGGSHNDTWQCFGYLDAITRFICEVCKILNVINNYSSKLRWLLVMICQAVSHDHY